MSITIKILKIADYQPHRVDFLLAENKEYKKLGTSDRKSLFKKEKPVAYF